MPRTGACWLGIDQRPQLAVVMPRECHIARMGERIQSCLKRLDGLTPDIAVLDFKIERTVRPPSPKAS